MVKRSLMKCQLYDDELIYSAESRRSNGEREERTVGCS